MNYFFMVEYVITRQIKIAVLQNETKALSEKISVALKIVLVLVKHIHIFA